MFERVSDFSEICWTIWSHTYHCCDLCVCRDRGQHCPQQTVLLLGACDPYPRCSPHDSESTELLNTHVNTEIIIYSKLICSVYLVDKYRMGSIIGHQFYKKCSSFQCPRVNKYHINRFIGSHCPKGALRLGARSILL